MDTETMIKKRKLLSGWILDPGKQGTSINCCVCVKLPQQKQANLFTVLKLVEKSGQLEGRLEISLDEVLLPLIDICNNEAAKRQEEIERLQQLIPQYREERTPTKKPKPLRKKKKSVRKPVPIVHRKARPARRRPESATPQPPVDTQKPQPVSSHRVPAKQPRRGPSVPERNYEGYDEIPMGSLPDYEQEMIKQLREEKAGAKPTEDVLPVSGVLLPHPEERVLYGHRRELREERTR